MDLRSLSDAQVDQIRSTLGNHGVVFFRDQELNEVDHISLAERFGTININRFFAAHPDHPEIAMVLKEPDDDRNIGGLWHTDHSYDHEPALGSILVARDLPPVGGDTHFTSMFAAFDALDDEMKEFCLTHNAEHSAHHAFGTEADGYGESDPEYEGRLGNAAAADELKNPIHPMVIAHPISGKPALFVNIAFTIGIVGVDPDESRRIIKTLYDHATQERFVHRFRWEPGSVAFWDNRAVWHNAMNDYAGHRRLMHRITIEGDPLHAAAA